MDEAFRFGDELGPFKLVHIHRLRSASRQSSRSTTLPAGQRSAACAWRLMSAPKKPSAWRGR
jgi:hypothetical protein